MVIVISDCYNTLDKSTAKNNSLRQSWGLMATLDRKREVRFEFDRAFSASKESRTLAKMAHHADA